ncbi:hypothetical protein HMPREF3038_01234 [Akkermansia sp. KLE1797]|nr:hypothetical protein HMPREF3038_01234 [Akkermansia sp. KLE1797]KXU52858.1 hypothetical protein HMPREF3039_03024 [Akkermansia sp. KLE1798]KZA04180.1 hypothetical protein HMPREF1326_02103 [Akkermansia sp. KLE1605]
MPEDARLPGLRSPDKILHFRPAIRKEKIARQARSYGGEDGHSSTGRHQGRIYPTYSLSK